MVRTIKKIQKLKADYDKIQARMARRGKTPTLEDESERLMQELTEISGLPRRLLGRDKQR